MYFFSSFLKLMAVNILGKANFKKDMWLLLPREEEGGNAFT